MFKWKKEIVCLVVLFVAFNFILVPKSEALLSNITGWYYEQKGDFSSNMEEQLECYKAARDFYKEENNNDAYERMKRKIGLLVGYDLEEKGDSSSNKNEKIEYYKGAIDIYEYGKCYDDKARVERKLNDLKSLWQKLFD